MKAIDREALQVVCTATFLRRTEEGMQGKAHVQGDNLIDGLHVDDQRWNLRDCDHENVAEYQEYGLHYRIQPRRHEHRLAETELKVSVQLRWLV